MRFESILISSVIIFLFSCNGKKEKESTQENSQSTTDCIERILEADAAFGEQRNHACETISLSETIGEYTRQLRSMDFSDCPEAFTLAFSEHTNAWDRMVPVTSKYEDLRGEMHVLFDSIEKMEDSTLFKKRLDYVWSTWEAVEAAKKKYATDEATDRD